MHKERKQLPDLGVVLREVAWAMNQDGGLYGICQLQLNMQLGIHHNIGDMRDIQLCKRLCNLCSEPGSAWDTYAL